MGQGRTVGQVTRVVAVGLSVSAILGEILGPGVGAAKVNP